ncbi:hypothetical protein RBU49_04175 [Clostridium sp. MB40-C1]|uniref:hypothetical protein n=1 Tax=Clostridium sp. MB40-C1 TaxID=3070996 RepID=UPI0027DFDCDA|nr:hypothetical protein [Clostridium sp. MB40-C1]WMJ81459.1 hypothetical protein RBU49_04175 [Clostridium sp. MB40-C1]
MVGGDNIIYENSVIESIRARFQEKGSPSKIPLIKGNRCFSATMKNDGIYVDNLNTQPFLPWVVFVETVKLITIKGGKALKGDAMNSKLGSGNLLLDSIEGYIACSIYGKKINDSVFRRISPIAGILIWASICRNEPGYLVLNDSKQNIL